MSYTPHEWLRDRILRTALDTLGGDGGCRQIVMLTEKERQRSNAHLTSRGRTLCRWSAHWDKSLRSEVMGSSVKSVSDECEIRDLNGNDTFWDNVWCGKGVCCPSLQGRRVSPEWYNWFWHMEGGPRPRLPADKWETVVKTSSLPFSQNSEVLCAAYNSAEQDEHLFTRF
jgi:hypothetical protein